MDKERKKELQAQYRQRKIMMGVIQIKNRENGKIFVGAYPDLNNHWQNLQTRLDSGLFSSGALVRDWKTYGAGAFTCEVLEEAEQPEGSTPETVRQQLNKMAREWMELLEPYGEKGYNRKAAW